MRKLGPRGKSLIQQWEEFVPFTYDDGYYPPRPYRGGAVKGALTIGYGHTAAAGEPIPGPSLQISEQEAQAIFDRDIQRYVADVNRLVTTEVSQDQFDALVSFHYNTGALAKSTLLKRVNAGQFDQVPAEFMKWVNDNGKKLDGLVNRRRAEVALWRGLTTDKVAPARTKVDPPRPTKSIAKSKIGNTSIAVGAAGALEAASQFSTAVSAAQNAHESMGLLGALLRSPSFLIALVIIILAGAIWHWRRQMLEEEGA